MNRPRRAFAFLLLAATLGGCGCQQYAAAEVRRGTDLPASLFAPRKPAFQVPFRDLSAAFQDGPENMSRINFPAPPRSYGGRIQPAGGGHVSGHHPPGHRPRRP